MDLPPFHHHRYVPLSDNPSFYHPQPHRLPPPAPPPTIPTLPPPATPPPPPPPHHLSLPPPPPLPPPSQSQFSFRPSPTIEERSSQLSNYIPSHLLKQPRPAPRLPSPPRVPSYNHNNRSQPRFDDNSRFSYPWPDLPLLPRVQPEHPLHHHNHHRPISPLRPHTGSYTNDFQSSHRFRDEFMHEGFRDDVNPQLPLWGRKEIRFDARDDVDDHKYRYGGGRERYEWSSDRMDRDFVSADSQSTDFSLKPSRNFELDVGNYELYNDREEDLRWHNSSLERDRDYGNNDGPSLHIRGERRELFESSGYEDVSRSNNHRVGDKRADEIFTRSPRKKQLQKKSVLQRIQLGKANYNNRNRSHDHGHFSKSYHDESNSSAGGSFKWKEKDVFVRLERQLEEEREKSPMELDVSFKSNALVAKAIKTTPSPVVDLQRKLTPRNKKIRKINLSDSPGIKLSENLDEAETSTDHFDKDHRGFAKNVVSDKTDRPTHGSHHSARCEKGQKSAGKGSAVRTESCINGSDIPDDSDKDLGQLAKEIRVSASVNLSSGGSQPCSSGLGGKRANEESPKSAKSSHDAKDVASDSTVDRTPTKRKRGAIPLQSKRDCHEATGGDYSSADSLLQASPLDEGLSKRDGHEAIRGDYSSADSPLQAIPRDEGLLSSAGVSIVSAVASEFLTDVLADEKVKRSSQEASDSKNNDIEINSRQPFLPQSLLMASVSQNSGDAYVCESPDHAEISVHDGCFGLNFDKVVEHSFQDDPILFENGPSRNIMDLVEGNATKENKVHGGQMEAYTSRNEGCSTSSSELTLCRMSEKIEVADSMKANSEESFQNQVSVSEANDIVEGSSIPVSSVGNNAVHCVAPSKLEAVRGENPTLINSTVDLQPGSVESKVPDGQMEAYASRNERCSTSSSEQRLCRMSEKIEVAESMNATSELSSPNQVSISEVNDIVEGSSNPVSFAGNNAVLCVSPSKLEVVSKENTTWINSSVDLRLGSPDMASRGSMDNFVSSKNQKASCGDDNCETNLPYMDNLASLSNNLSLHVDVSRVFSTNSADRLMDSDREALFNNMTCSSEDVPSNKLLDMQNSKSRQSEISNEQSGKQKIFIKNPVSGVDTVGPFSLSSRTDAKLGQALNLPVNSQKVLPLSQNNSKVILNSNSLPDKSSLSNDWLTTSIHGGFPGRTPVKYPSVGKAPTFNHVSRSSTWHRTGTPSQSVAGPKNHVSSRINSRQELGKVQSSYIRKGNSLVRNPPPVGAVPQGLNASSPTLCRLSPGIDNLKNARGSGNGTNVIGPSTSATMGGFVAGPEGPKTPPLTGTVKSLNCTPADREDSTCSWADQFRNNCPGEILDPSNSAENMNVKKCSEDGLKPSGVKECEASSRSNLDGQSTIDVRNSGKKITYVKRKSNQLVAASNSSDPSFQSSEKPQALSSDGYYKRRKNQLIRTSVEDNVKQSAVIPGKCLSSQRQEAPKNTQNRSSSERQTGFAKKKFSLVWTPHGTLSSKKDGNSGHFHSVRPFLFPWKRAVYWTNFKHSLSSIANDNLASAISRKLLLSQKSDTIYKRSFSGFSLRRSKVLGFSGRSLKWSKSIERNSRKANEVATLAVVAAEKRKREQNGAAFTPFKSRNYVSRGRIFRIGSERYRMDPTGKTLQRISDEKPSYSQDQSETNTKKSFVPRRLLIGNDEYVRIGNGNQLVRDPKKRTRVLANEKVRWSLHTARLRLARKKKYCQFFTRFGKCNKDDKKCPYIHDPSKIVVCTKFLNGTCSNSNCKLTHKVIPERMQDCSYFLQGLCSNESCPYRHVNVNPNSPICEGFLRGYCADGNECRKKHTYVCPVFEATGNCEQGAECKLHHPKTKKKGTKSKTSTLRKNVRGRYFGAGLIDIANGRTTVPQIITGEYDDDFFCQEGKFTDFISLADGEEAMEDEVFEPRVGPSCDNDREEPSDMQVDLDELIKPLRIMKKNLVLDSSPAIDSTGEMTESYVSEES